MEFVTGLDVDVRERTSCGQSDCWVPKIIRGRERGRKAGAQSPLGLVGWETPSAPTVLSQPSGGAPGPRPAGEGRGVGQTGGQAQRGAVLVAQASRKKYHRLGG